MLKLFRLDLGRGEGLKEIAKLNRLVAMVLHVDSLSCGQDRSASVELGGVKAHAHVGDESAEHEHEIGGFDVFANMLVAAHGTAVNAEVKRMIFGNRALA